MFCTIFDLDGTLLYTLEDLASSTNFALEKLGCPKRSIDEVRTFVGNGVKVLIEKALPNNKKELLERCLEIFKEHYIKNADNNTHPYSGIMELLKKLNDRGINIAINSNKYDAAVKKMSKKWFCNLVSFAQGECLQCPRKPSPAGVEIILSKLGCTKDKTVYIGDSLIDIQTAKNAGIKCISVSWGYCHKELLEKNNPFVANNTEELYHMIKKVLN